MPSSGYQRFVHLVVDSLRLPREVKVQMLRFFRSSFLSEYSDALENFGLHMVQENPDELYTYAPEHDRWVQDRLTAGYYFFPELYEDRGHGVVSEVAVSDLPALMSETRSKATERARSLHFNHLSAIDGIPVSFSSAELGIEERGAD